MTKALLYLLAIGISGILSVVFIVLFTIKKESKYKKIFLGIGITGLIVFVFITTQFISKVYTKIEKGLNEVNKKSEEREKISKEKTEQQLRLLKAYEPEIYKGQIPEDYYTYYGFYDWWRFPLVYPYSISCIDILDAGTLDNDLEKTDIKKGGLSPIFTPWFDTFIFDKNYFIGHIIEDRFNSNNKDTHTYFLLSFSDSQQSIISEEELKNKLSEIKFSGDTTFISIRDYSEKF